jgi:small subunit ribosomal protein S6
MNNYEVMFIIKPELSEEEKKNLFSQLNDLVVKNKGKVNSANIWLERKKLFFPIKRHREGVYYLMNFDIAPSQISELRHAYKLNEQILRVLVTKL